MQGFRFYLEYESITAKRRDPGAREWRKHSEGNVIAVFGPWWHGGDGAYKDAIGALLFEPNSPVCGVNMPREHLQRCRRIPEALAREIHPRLFAWLDHLADVEREHARAGRG